MERPMVTAVTHTSSEGRVTVSGVSDEPGVAGRIFAALAAANVNVDMIIQNEPVTGDQKADLSFTVGRDELRTAAQAIEALGVGERILTDERIGKAPIVGAGMRSHPGVAARVFETLGEHEINIEMISTSPIKISCVIAADQVEQAVRALHAAFELGEADSARGPDRRSPAHRHVVSYRVGVLGATGAVGSTILQVLAERDFPLSELVPLASGRSAGKRIPFGSRRGRSSRGLRRGGPGARHRPQLHRRFRFGGVGAKIVQAGAVVIDNTSFWRMHPDVPLVVAEVNPDAASRPFGPDRQPELHDDADDGGACAIQREIGSSGSSSPRISRGYRAPGRRRSRSYMPSPRRS